jgi:F0F1-type ATP synthase assembly protein I
VERQVYNWREVSGRNAELAQARIDKKRKEVEMRNAMQKNLQPIPRTIHEANRDATYACAIQTFKSDAKLALDFIGEAVIGFIWVGITLGSAVGAVYLVFRG